VYALYAKRDANRLGAKAIAEFVSIKKGNIVLGAGSMFADVELSTLIKLFRLNSSLMALQFFDSPLLFHALRNVPVDQAARIQS
jgi:hypothetical protein